MSTMTTAELVHWLGEQTWSDFAQSLADFYDTKGYLTEKQEASARKMHAKCTAKQGAAKKVQTLTTDGVFAKDGEIYKVKWNQAHTSLYAARLHIHEEGEYTGTKKGEWIYVGKTPLYDLTEDDRLTYEKAKALGALYGVCVNCGILLTKDDSIYNGYGKTCAANNGWPYKKAPEVVVPADVVAPTEQLVVEL